jgi:sugar/nucleoside kinase (ribokinase family)
MASDRGSAPELSPRDLVPAWFDCDVLHVSGYSLLREPIASAVDEAVRHARSFGAHVSADVSTWTLVDDSFRARLAGLAPDLVFATEREREAVGGLDTRWVVKRGARGLTVDGAEHAALEVEVVDTTGAGDALAAGFLVGGPGLALESAARCCTRTGSMP